MKERMKTIYSNSEVTTSFLKVNLEGFSFVLTFIQHLAEPSKILFWTSPKSVLTVGTETRF